LDVSSALVKGEKKSISQCNFSSHSWNQGQSTAVHLFKV